jgi:hypothetical protein
VSLLPVRRVQLRRTGSHVISSEGADTNRARVERPWVGFCWLRVTADSVSPGSVGADHFAVTDLLTDR